MQKSVQLHKWGASAATHGQVIVGDAVAGGLAADAQEDRAARGAVVVTGTRSSAA